MNVEKMRKEINKYKVKKSELVLSDEKIRGSFIRSAIKPLLRGILKIKSKIDGHSLTIIHDDSQDLGKPVIYACTHICNYDVEMLVQALKKHFYILAGDWDLSYGTIDDYFFRVHGSINVDNEDKIDRRNSFLMAIKLLEQGTSVLWFPEGIWNLSPNLPILNLYSGVIRAASEANVDIVPVAIDQRGKDFYVNIGSNISPQVLKENGKDYLRDTLASLKWDIWESLPIEKREEIPDNYYDDFVMDKISVCNYMPKSVFFHRVYQDKNITTSEEVFNPGEFKKHQEELQHCFKWLTKDEEKELSFLEYQRYYYELRELYEKSDLNKLTLEQRKKIHPILLKGLKVMNRLNGFKLQVLNDEREKTTRPIIYAITHICKSDIELSTEAIKDHFYLLCGDFESLHDTLDGTLLGLNGVIYFNEKNKDERKDVKRRMKEALKEGTNIMYFPEGTWNLTPNLLLNQIYPGIIEVADETNAIIVPIGIEQYGKQFVSKIGKNFDVKKYNGDYITAKRDLRDVLATLKWEIFESVPMLKRREVKNDHYQKFIDERVGEWALSIETFTDAIYKDKNVITEDEVFAPIRRLNKK